MKLDPSNSKKVIKAVQSIFVVFLVRHKLKMSAKIPADHTQDHRTCGRRPQLKCIAYARSAHTSDLEI